MLVWVCVEKQVCGDGMEVQKDLMEVLTSSLRFIANFNLIYSCFLLDSYQPIDGQGCNLGQLCHKFLQQCSTNLFVQIIPLILHDELVVKWSVDQLTGSVDD